MTAAQICKDLIRQSGMTQRSVADAIGTTECGLSNKLRRNHLRAEEFLSILDAIGYDMKYVKAGNEVAVRKPGFRRATAIVSGEEYDTAKSSFLCGSDNNGITSWELYCKSNNNGSRYFVVVYGNFAGGKATITPISRDQAHELMENSLIENRKSLD